MENFFVLDAGNSVTVGGKPSVGNTIKGSATRKKLADISNLQQQPKPSNQDEQSHFIPDTTKEYIDHLKKENMALMKLLADRNKIIELSGIELQKLRTNLQKLQQQNLQLAQSNGQMLAELNSGKDRLKELHHELGCKNGLLIAKKFEMEAKTKSRTCENIDNEVADAKLNQARESSAPDNCDDKPCETNKKHKRQKSKSLGPSNLTHVQTKEKAEKKRQRVQRRQSARFKSEESTCNTVEIEDMKFPLRNGQIQENGSSVKKDGNEEPNSQESRRSSIARPSRQAAMKVHSYKEIPLNVKMRRST